MRVKFAGRTKFVGNERTRTIKKERESEECARTADHAAKARLFVRRGEIEFVESSGRSMYHAPSIRTPFSCRIETDDTRTRTVFAPLPRAQAVEASPVALRDPSQEDRHAIKLRSSEKSDREILKQPFPSNTLCHVDQPKPHPRGQAAVPHGLHPRPTHAPAAAAA